MAELYRNTGKVPIFAIAFACVFLPFIFLSGQAIGQQKAGSLVPPTGEEFSRQARTNWQRTKVIILDADGKLLINKVEKDVKISKPPLVSNKGFSKIVLAILVVAGLFLLYRFNATGGMFQRRARDVTLQDLSGQSDEQFHPEPSKEFSIDQLTGESREALRALMVQSLLQAARQNNIRLRRSLTTRDILAKIPNVWPYWANLNVLVRRAEPVIFGDEHIDAAELKEMIEVSRPIFSAPTRSGEHA